MHKISMAIVVLSLVTSSVYADLRIAVINKDGQPLNGVYSKVIMTRSCAAFEEPGGEGDSVGLPAFAIRYHVESPDGETEVAIDGAKWIRVGKSGSETKVDGWIPVEIREAGKSIPLVIFWDTRALVQPRSEALSETTPFSVYRSVNQHEEMLKLEHLPGSEVTICPILNQPEDPNDPIYNIAVFSGQATSDLQQTVQPSISVQDVTQEIVFVIDTTVSMGNLLDGVKQIAEQTAQTLAQKIELTGRVKFGLVEFQDSTLGLFPSKVTIPLTANPIEFVNQLRKVGVTTIPSEETKEDVLAGLRTAIVGHANSGDKDVVGWTEQSVKHIILLGDASAHLEGPKLTTKEDTIKEIIDLARPTGGGAEVQRVLGTITLHAVRAINPDDPADHLQCKQQFQEVSRNNGQEEGYYADVDPTEKEDIDRMIEGLTTIIGESINAMKKFSTSRVDTLNPSVGPIAKDLWIVHDLIESEKKYDVIAGYSNGITPSRKIVADLRILVHFDELDRYYHNLEFLIEAFSELNNSDERQDASNLLSAIQVLSASMILGDFVSMSSLPNALTILPFRSDVLKMKIDDFSAMDNDEYSVFLKKLSGSLERAKFLLDKKEAWHHLIGDEEKFAYLRLDELP